MNATELFKAGKLSEAVDAQVKEVKANPADPNRRLFLFELLAFTGDLDRARRQIEAVKYDDPDKDLALLRYARLLDSEALRRKAFQETGPVLPTTFTEPPFHMSCAWTRWRTSWRATGWPRPRPFSTGPGRRCRLCR